MLCKFPMQCCSLAILTAIGRIMFMREFGVIDSATSVAQLRLRLKDSELEQYGEPMIPEYVYEVIKRLPRFSSMRVSDSA